MSSYDTEKGVGEYLAILASLSPEERAEYRLLNEEYHDAFWKIDEFGNHAESMLAAERASKAQNRMSQIIKDQRERMAQAQIVESAPACPEDPEELMKEIPIGTRCDDLEHAAVRGLLANRQNNNEAKDQ
jgi:hypothetical protein